MMPWFRLYPELLKDPKLRRFNTVQKWLWITAMCEASQSNERGKLFIAEGVDYTDNDLAQAAGLSPAEFDQAQGFIELCVTLKMMERHADGGVTLTNFLSRQYEKPSDSPDKTRERKRKERAKKAEKKKLKDVPNVDVPVISDHSDNSHADVTPMSRSDTPSHAIDTDTDSYSETDSETDSEENKTPPPKSSSTEEHVKVVVVGERPLHVYKSALDQYKHYFAYEPNKTIIDLLNSYLDDGVQMDMIAWAMRDAAEKAKQWNYAKGTVEKLFSRGIRTAEQAESADHEFKLQKQLSANSKVVPIRSDKLPDSVQRQIERESQGTTKSGEKRKVMDDPELAALYQSLRGTGG